MSQLVCCYLACEQGGPGGGGEGKSFPHSLPFSPTPLGELACMLFTTELALRLNHCHCFNTSLCHL